MATKSGIHDQQRDIWVGQKLDYLYEYLKVSILMGNMIVVSSCFTYIMELGGTPFSNKHK